MIKIALKYSEFSNLLKQLELTRIPILNIYRSATLCSFDIETNGIVLRIEGR